jgi:hypothetical protein
VAAESVTGDEWKGSGALQANHDAADVLVRLSGVADRAVVTFDVRPGGGPDVKLLMGPGDRAQIVQAAWTDPIAYMYGLARHYVPVDRADLRPGSGAWVSPRLILNRPYTVPSSGERRAVELVDVGRLRSVTRDGDTVTARIPWALLTFSDPSSHHVWKPRGNGAMGTQKVGPIRIAYGGQTLDYDWDDWTSVRWRERRKAGWDAVARAFAETAR